MKQDLSLDDYFTEWARGNWELMKRQGLAKIISGIGPINISSKIRDENKIAFILTAAIWHNVEMCNFVLGISVTIETKLYVEALFNMIRRNHIENPMVTARSLMALVFISNETLLEIMFNENFPENVQPALRLIANNDTRGAISAYANSFTEARTKSQIVKVLNEFAMVSPTIEEVGQV